MVDLNQLIDIPVFSIVSQEKVAIYQKIFHDLTRHHYQHCQPYRKILQTLAFDLSNKKMPENVPFIPVRLFKTHELLSVEKNQVIKTLTSSGTSGQAVSKIFLDHMTATIQTKVLAKITSHFIGEKRLPMLVIDTKAVLKDRHLFSARGAGILGFSMMGRNITYALDENMKLDLDVVETFCIKHRNEGVLLFGFTHMIWEHFYKELIQLKHSLSLENGILIHGGGWKKLAVQEVDNNTFKHSLERVCGLKKIHNYYGMVEQTGSIFMECEAGFLHCSIFSDIIIRNKNFSVCAKKEPGIIQLLSLLPWSYPGHAILSEDLGEIMGEDDCFCGRLGKYFRVYGRIKEAEIRGCGDTYATN